MPYLIERLWFDELAKENPFGYTPIGTVASKEEADRICALELIPKAQHPWPLSYVPSLGDSVPRFRAKELGALDGMSAAELMKL